MFALANGGIFGDGLGQGTAKWNYLPNAHNDFIFAIIGEELGLVGALGLLALFGLFAYTGMRIARRSADPFLRLLTATTTMWVIGQSFINVGYVIGLLPVTGIQLPLISAGGTSTATTLLMIGMMANAARHEPEAVAALRAGRDDRMNRLLRLPLPEPYAPTRVPRRCATGCEAGAASPSRGASRPPLVPHGRRESLRWMARGLGAPPACGGGGTSRLRGRIMEADSGTPASVMHTPAVAHWKVSATGERLGQRANRGLLVVGGARGHGGTAGHVEPAYDGRRRRPGRP